MKRKIGLGVMAIFLLALCLAPMAGAASITALSEEDGLLEREAYDGEDTLDQGDGEDALQAVPSASNAGAADIPGISWDYSVSLTSLTSPFNTLVNRDNMLESSFIPEDLVKMSVKRATSAAIQMERTAGAALERMFEEAAEKGIQLYLKSGYRSYGTQKTTYANYLDRNNGKDDGVVAPPGASEHQTGLACDILNKDYAGRDRMTSDFSATKEAQWMKENCAQFGFVLSYPDGKQEITKTIFEPWHFRYVGKEIASYIMRKELTMEEFWDEWQLEVAAFQERGGDVDTWIEYEATLAVSGGQPIFYFSDVLGEDGDQEVAMSYKSSSY